jgi:hypothetical protein
LIRGSRRTVRVAIYISGNDHAAAPQVREVRARFDRIETGSRFLI